MATPTALMLTTYKVVAVSYEKSLVLSCATQSQSKLTVSDPIVEQIPRYIRIFF
jgi:hypothetical protein